MPDPAARHAVGWRPRTSIQASRRERESEVRTLKAKEKGGRKDVVFRMLGKDGRARVLGLDDDDADADGEGVCSGGQ